MLGLLEDGVPTLGVIDLPFLGVRVDSGALADVGSLEEAIVGMGDAFHRGGARLDAYLELTMSVHRRALRFRCVGAASVLWTWLVGGQIQGMLLAHNNPYDVVAGHAIARAAGAICTDYAGALGFLRPRRRMRTLGTELAGVVASVGKNVTRFRVGDEVFGRVPPQRPDR